MSEEPTIKDVLVAINEFATSVDRRFDRLENRVERIEDTMATKEDLQNAKDELLTHVDGLALAHNRMDLEVVSLRSRVENLESAPA